MRTVKRTGMMVKGQSIIKLSRFGGLAALVLVMAIVLVFAASGSPGASAAPVSTALTVNNAGFEAFNLPNNCQFSRPFGTTGGCLIFSLNPIPSWTLTPSLGDGGSFNPGHVNEYPGGIPEGQNVAYSSQASAPIISQVLSSVLTANTRYTLLVEVGSRSDLPSQGYFVQLFAGGTLLAQDNSSLTITSGTFATSTVIYDALPGDSNLGTSLEIRLANASVNSSQTNFDDVRLTTGLAVEIDIKPGSDPNCFNSNDHGVIPVAILGSASFDASTVNPLSVVLDGQAVRVKGKSGNAGSLEDVNNDGFSDLVVQIIDDAAYVPGSTIGTVTGQLNDGTPFIGTDSICITQ